MNDDDAIERQLQSIPELAKITPDSMSAALQGLALDLDGGLEWFARAVQGALYTARPADEEASERKENRKVQQELFRLCKRASDTWVALEGRSSEADIAIWEYTARDGGYGEPPEHKVFQDAIARMEVLSVVLRRAAMMMDVQRRGWRLKAHKDLRVRQAVHLAIVYRSAFGKEPSAHTRPGKPPPWPELYKRIIKTAFGLRGTNDIPGILDEASKAERVTIAHGWIPDKPL